MNIASIGWIGFWPIFLIFILEFTGRMSRINRPGLYLSLFIVTALFFYEQWTGHLIGDLRKEPFGWGSIWNDRIWSDFFFLYYCVIIGTSLFVLFLQTVTARKRIEKKHASIIFISSVITLIFGLATDIIFPQIGYYGVPNLGDVFAIFWGTGLVYSIVKYEFLVLTPGLAAENIISTMNDSLVLISPEMKIIFANKYTYSLLGYPDNALTGKPVEMIIPDKKIDQHIFEKNTVSRGVSSASNFSLEYLTVTGERMPVSFTGSIIRDRDKNVVGIIGIARDMRNLIYLAKKEKELAIAEVMAEKERYKAEELKKAYDELKKTQAMLVQSEKLRALGQLGAGVAHELNSPLAGILCLMRSIQKQKDPAGREYSDLKAMEEGCEFMAKIIKYLSDFTRDTKEDLTDLNVNDVIESTLVLISPQLKRKRIEMDTLYGKDLPLVRANKRQMQQLVMNMVTNARDAVKEDGRISISTKKDEDNGKIFAEIHFSDTGPGIDESIRDRVFEHFFTTKEKGKGIGLGLAIVKDIVDAHKGSIELRIGKEKGALFVIRFPGATV